MALNKNNFSLQNLYVFDGILTLLIAAFMYFVFPDFLKYETPRIWQIDFGESKRHFFYAELLNRLAFSWFLVGFFNTALIMSPWRSTFGMKFCKFYLTEPDGSDPRFFNALRAAFLLSPATIFSVILMGCNMLTSFSIDVYNLGNSFILGLTVSAIYSQWLIYRFGSDISIIQEITGLEIRSQLIPTQNIQSHTHGVYKKIGTGLGTLLCVYLSGLIILDLFKKLDFEKDLYKVQDINWGKNNLFFALYGLNAPADVNAYEYARSDVHQLFKLNEERKAAASISPAFPKPLESDFAVFKSYTQPPLEFKGETKSFECLYIIDSHSKQPCASEADLNTAIKNNSVLWHRYSNLPQYTDFSRPPFGLASASSAENFIRLSRWKAAHIIQIQRQGHSEIAFAEWQKYQEMANRLVMTRSNMTEKAVFMIVHGIFLQSFETLLYNDPGLIQLHYKETVDLIQPHGIGALRAAELLKDDFSQIEPLLLYATGRSTGIRNTFYNCIDKKYGELLALPADQYFKQNNQPLCPELQSGSVKGLMGKLVFLNTGNPISNLLWGLLYGGIIPGSVLADTMYGLDITLRMSRLATEIYKEDIKAGDVSVFLTKTSSDLQNPITKKPFDWDEKGKYLWYELPARNSQSSTIRKFHLNI